MFCSAENYSFTVTKQMHRKKSVNDKTKTLLKYDLFKKRSFSWYFTSSGCLSAFGLNALTFAEANPDNITEKVFLCNLFSLHHVFVLGLKILTLQHSVAKKENTGK